MQKLSSIVIDQPISEEIGSLDASTVKNARLLDFDCPGRDVYNPTCPFTVAGRTFIAGRTESRDGHDSTVRFFECAQDNVWREVEGAPELVLEDPFALMLDGSLVLGGVHVDWKGADAVNYYTVFYRGADIFSLKLVSRGPDYMKDIRICPTADGRLAVLTRPNHPSVTAAWGGGVRIGFTVVPSLEEINAESLLAAKTFEGMFAEDEWGGANQLHLLPSGLIGVVGHKSFRDENGGLHYYGVSFVFDPATMERTPVKPLIKRCCFPDAPPKQPRLADVTFTSGIIRRGDGSADIYTGLSDSYVGAAVIPDPFAGC